MSSVQCNTARHANWDVGALQQDWKPCSIDRAASPSGYFKAISLIECSWNIPYAANNQTAFPHLQRARVKNSQDDLLSIYSVKCKNICPWCCKKSESRTDPCGNLEPNWMTSLCAASCFLTLKLHISALPLLCSLCLFIPAKYFLKSLFVGYFQLNYFGSWVFLSEREGKKTTHHSNAFISGSLFEDKSLTTSSVASIPLFFTRSFNSTKELINAPFSPHYCTPSSPLWLFCSVYLLFIVSRMQMTQ